METIKFYEEIVQEKNKDTALTKLKSWWTKSHCTLTSIEDETKPGCSKDVFIDPEHYIIDFQKIPYSKVIKVLVVRRNREIWEDITKEQLNTDTNILRKREENRIMDRIKSMYM